MIRDTHTHTLMYACMYTHRETKTKQMLTETHLAGKVQSGVASVGGAVWVGSPKQQQPHSIMGRLLGDAGMV